LAEPIVVIEIAEEHGLFGQFQPGLFADLPSGRLLERLSLVHAAGRHLGAGIDVAMVEDEDLRASCDVDDDALPNHEAKIGSSGSPRSMSVLTYLPVT
jgi:hypothetical protein